jgi:tetratricopeptide (TPR) repeat protein
MIDRSELDPAVDDAPSDGDGYRGPLTLALAALVLVLLVVGAGGGLFVYQQAAERRRAVEAALDRAEALRQESRLDKAAAALEQAQLALGAPEPADPRQRPDVAEAERALVSRLEAIRQRRVAVVDGRFDNRTAARDYAAAFKEAGLGVVGDDEEEVAKRVRASGVSGQLVAALDDWASVAAEPEALAWLLGVARRADPDPWRDRLRDPAVRRDRQALRALADDALRGGGAKLNELSPQLLGSLGALLGGGPEAVPLLRAAQRRYPSDFWLNVELAHALGNAKQSEEAVGYFRVVVALRPDAAAARNNLGVALYDTKDLDAAIAEYRRAIELDPKLASAYSNLGRALVDKCDLDGGIAACRKAIQLDPKLVTAHNTIGLALYKKGDLDGAIAAFRTVLQLDPKYATAHSNLGDALRAKRDLDGAVAAYRAAIALDPTDAKAHRNLGLALAARKDGDGAVAAFRKAIDLDPKNVILVAAATQENDAKGLPDEVRVTFRRQALDRLRDDLALYAKLAERDAAAKRFVREQLTPWRDDPNFAPLRDKAALEKLPEDERKPWRALWDEVAAVLKKVQERPE